MTAKERYEFIRDNIHEMSNPVFWKKKINVINLLSAEFAKRVVKVKAPYKRSVG